jgi:hypothetical protein
MIGSQTHLTCLRQTCTRNANIERASFSQLTTSTLTHALLRICKGTFDSHHL